MKDISKPNKQVETLYDKIAFLIENSRKQTVTTVNLVMVYTYYKIGHYIIENEQQGE